MRRWCFSLEVLTPMFVSGENQDLSELRPPSVRGELRFWFRALAGPYVAYNTELLRDLEGSVFGDTKRASSFTLRIRDVQKKPLSGPRRISPGLAYLGYGPISYVRKERGNVPVREPLGPGSRCTLDLLFRSSASARALRALEATLWTWANLGALGSRARRGFGSIRLTPKDTPSELWKAVDTNRGSLQGEARALGTGITAAREALRDLVRSIAGGASKDSQPGQLETGPDFFVLAPGHCGISLAEMRNADWSRTLDAFGQCLKAFRTECRDDARFVRRFLETASPDRSPIVGTVNRASFGLPVGFFFPRSRAKALVEASVGTANDKGRKEISRRASPLMIRLSAHASPQERICRLVIVHSKGPLLPKNGSLVLKGVNPKRGPVGLTGEPTDLVTPFLKQLPGGFPGKVEQVSFS